MPNTVPPSAAAEYPSCSNAVRATMFHMSSRRGWARRLRTLPVRPIQIGPLRLMRVPSAQSSMSRPRMLSTPPACRKAARRTSMQPPAAAASGLSGSLTRGNG